MLGGPSAGMSTQEGLGIVPTQESIGVLSTQQDLGVLSTQQDLGVPSTQESVGVVSEYNAGTALDWVPIGTGTVFVASNMNVLDFNQWFILWS